MWQRPLNGAWGRFSQHIGPGRGIENQGIQITLTIERQGGAGLIWPLKVSDQPCRAWCDAAAWCQWIEPMLSVPAFEAIDQALLPALALWSWCVAPPFNAGEAGSAVQVSEPALGTVACEWDPVLTLVRDQNRLMLRLLDWPYDWLLEQSSAWPALQQETQKKGPCVAVSLALGWCILPGHALKALQVGEGLLLQSSIDIKRNQAWLFYQRPLAQLRFSTPQQAVIEATMAEIEQTPFEAAGSDQIPLTLVVEIGQWVVPLSALASLEIGQIIEGEAAFDGVVRLKINGCTLGYATLVQMGESWVARIDQLVDQWSGAVAANSQGAVSVESVMPPAVTDKIIEEKSQQGELETEVAGQGSATDQMVDSMPVVKVPVLEEQPASDGAVNSNYAEFAVELTVVEEHVSSEEAVQRVTDAPAAPVASEQINSIDCINQDDIDTPSQSVAETVQRVDQPAEAMTIDETAPPNGCIADEYEVAVATIAAQSEQEPNESTESAVKETQPVAAITQDLTAEQPLADNEHLTEPLSEKSAQAQSKPSRAAGSRGKKRASTVAERFVPSSATGEQGDAADPVAERNTQQAPYTRTPSRGLLRVKKSAEAVRDQDPAKAKTLPSLPRVARKKVSVKVPPNDVMP